MISYCLKILGPIELNTYKSYIWEGVIIWNLNRTPTNQWQQQKHLIKKWEKNLKPVIYFITCSFMSMWQLTFLFKYKFNNFSHYLIIRKQNAPLSTEWEENLIRCFPKEDIQIVNKQIKRCSTLLIVWEMQVKTTMRCQLTPLRMAIIYIKKKNLQIMLERVWIKGNPLTQLVQM